MQSTAFALALQQSGATCAGPVEETISGWGQYSSHVSAAQQSSIDQLAAVVVTSFAQTICPPFRRVKVVGHADKDYHGTTVEKSVSRTRAMTIKEALTASVKRQWEERKMGPPPVGGVEWRMYADGAQHLIAPPYHAKNRRVVVTLFRFGPPIKPQITPTEFRPGVMHNHLPSGEWETVQANPNSPGASVLLIAACKISSPSQLTRSAITEELLDKPIAFAHVQWYLHVGNGRDFVEDENIALWLQQDNGIRGELAARIPTNQKSGVFVGHFHFGQDQYDTVTGADFKNSFGGIDRVDFEVDFDAGTLHVWFQDRYEWHPFYPGLYTVQPGDAARPTNCVHAAFVEQKNSGAADFWMKGEAKVPLKGVVTR